MLTVAAKAAPGFVTISASRPNPSVGHIFAVSFRLFDYTDQAEIDSFRFDVRWPPELFELVPDSFDLGADEGSDQQWLSKPNQESRFEGYVLRSFCESTGPGRVHVHLRDIGTGQIESGTTAHSGFLVAFRLRAVGSGTGLIRVAPHDGATGPETFYGTAGTVLGVPQFSALSRTVVASPRLSVQGSQASVVVWWSTNAAGYRLQGRLGLGANTSWNNVNTSITTSNGFHHVALPRIPSQLFFRLTNE